MKYSSDCFTPFTTPYLHDEFCALGFAGARLATDDNALVLPQGGHTRIRRGSDGEEVRWQSSQNLPFVFPHHVHSISIAEHLVWIHRYQNRT